MKALVYYGPGQRSWDDVPDARVQAPTDAVIRVDSVTICGTDLHILKGDVPEVRPGTVLGHEAVGTVVEVGEAVSTIRVGDRVLASCITSCGRCAYCREGDEYPVLWMEANPAKRRIRLDVVFQAETGTPRG